MCEIIETFAFIASWRGILIYFARTIKGFSNHNSARYLLILFGISHGCVLAISLLQKLTYKKITQQNFMIRLLFATTVNLLIFVVAVLAWIFYWSGIPYFIKTDMNKAALYLLYHFVSFIIAVISRTSGMLVGSSNDSKDGNTSPGKTVHYQIEYLSIFFKVKKFSFRNFEKAFTIRIIHNLKKRRTAVCHHSQAF
jgi:hypothetical protein